MLNQNIRLKRICEGILRAAETKPAGASEIRGASGLAHPVIAVGTDDIRRRLIVISAEADGRTAALAQGDIQMAVGSMQVLFASVVRLK